MKIRNFAFFGVMASILAISGANAVETTRQLATKAYVDNKAADANYRSNANYANNTIGKAIQDLASVTGELDQAIAGLDVTDVTVSGQPIVSVGQTDGFVHAAAGTIGTAGIDDDAVTFAKLNSAAVATTVAATGSTSAAKVPTETAVRAAIGDAITTAASDARTGLGTGTDQGTSGQPIVTVNQTNGVVTATAGTITDAGLANNAVTTAKIDDDAVTFAKLNSAAVVTSTETIASHSSEDTSVPTTAAVAAAIAGANSNTTGAIEALDGHNAVSSTGVSAGAAADEDKEGWAVVSVVQSNGDVTSTLGQLDNRAVATGANIEYAKMDAGIVNLDDQTATCSTTNPCMLTYVGNNTYKWTNMIETTDETLTAAQGN